MLVEVLDTVSGVDGYDDESLSPHSPVRVETLHESIFAEFRRSGGFAKKGTPIHNRGECEVRVERSFSNQIGGEDLGPITFHLLPSHFQVKIEAVLGMEFFLTHQVFIDFLEGQVYFAPR